MSCEETNSRERFPDAEYVDRVRRNLARTERLRLWSLAVYLAGAAGIVWLTTWVAGLLPRILQPPLNAIPGFVGLGLGAVFGLWIGLTASHVAAGLATVLFHHRAQRTERLLVRYHDALCAMASPNAQNTDTDGRR